MVNGLSAGLFAAAFLLVSFHRLHKQGKADNARMYVLLAGALALTFTAAEWFPGLYMFTSHGLGLSLLAAALAYGGWDFFFHVVKKDGWDKNKTARAAVAFGIAGMLTFANWTGVMHGVQSDLHGTGYNQVMSKVSHDGNGG